MVSHRTHIDIGLTGQAGAGKDTAAQVLMEAGYRRVAFADQVRELALTINPTVLMPPSMTWWRLADAVEAKGWDIVKRGNPEVRRLLESIGKGVRDVIGPDAWVNAARRQAEEHHLAGHPCVFTDVRYLNEAQMIGPGLIRIVRPELGPPTNPSDINAATIPVRHTIYNGGSPEDLRENLLALLQEEYPWMPIPHT